jgi:hypothetical protein
MIDAFNGIRIYIYDNDHNPPHFHAIYGNERALIDIDTLEIMAGELPPAQLRKVRKWAKDKQQELRQEFERINP